MSQAQIQTYASCVQATYPDVIRRYRDVLVKLGCTDQNVLDWVTEITWPRSDNDGFGDIYAAPVHLAPAENIELECSGIEVSLYTQPAIPSLEELPSWVGFNLLVDTELMQAHTSFPYSPEAGKTIWHILQELALAFPEIGAYFTDEWQENQAWRVIAERAGDPWVFDLGVFPRKLAGHFEMVPSGFKGTVVDAGFGFIQTNRWQSLPWEEK